MEKKKFRAILIILIVLFSLITIWGPSVVAEKSGPMGPAPESGDGISNGSGFDHEGGANEESPGMGPAPNSGDGVPDGPGW